jgi:hypothetical protein
MGESLVDRLKSLGVSRRSKAGRALLQAAELGYITDLECAMDECFYPEALGGKGHFEKILPQPEWIPTADHKVMAKDEGPLVPENVRLAHRICNRIAGTEAEGGSATRDRAKVARLIEQLRASADVLEAISTPDLGKALEVFAARLRAWDLEVPTGRLQLGTAADVSGNAWHVRFVVRSDDRGSFIEYYATNRFVWGDMRERIYADGVVMPDLPTLEPVVIIRPGEDEEEAKRSYAERNRAIADELRRAGLM